MLRLLSTVALCSALFAQDKVSPNRFVPQDSCLVLRLGAPATWQQQFATTQVAKLLQSKALAPMVEGTSKGVAEVLGKIREEGKVDADLVKGLLEDYRGSLVFSLQLDFDDLQSAMEEDRPPHMTAVFALSPDGAFDLGALAQTLQKAAEGAPNTRVTDLKVDEHLLRVAQQTQMQMSLPAMIDGHLVILLGDDLEKTAAKTLAAEGRHEHAGDDAPMFCHVELGKVIAAITRIATQQMDMTGNELPFAIDQMVADLGFACLESFEMQLGAEDKRLAASVSLTTNGGDRGLFGSFLVLQGQPKLLRYVPPAAEFFGVGGLDLGALYRTIAKVWTSLADVVPMSLGDAEAAFTEATKVRLKEDLLDHLGTEFLTIGDLQAQMAAAGNLSEDQDPAEAMSGYLLGLSLRSGKAFGEALEKALRSRGLHAGRKTEEYQGSKVHRLKVAGVLDLEYAVTDDLLLLAFGSDESSHRDLRAILDQRASGAAEPSEAMQKRLADLPEGWNGLSVTPMASLIGGVRQALTVLETTAELPEAAAGILQMLDGVAGELQRLGLHEMVGTTHATERSWTSRLRW